MLIGLFTFDLASKAPESTLVQQVTRLGQALSYLQISLSVQIRRVNVADRIGLT